MVTYQGAPAPQPAQPPQETKPAAKSGTKKPAKKKTT